MPTNDEIKKLLYSLKHSYDDKDLQESLTLLEKLIDRETSSVRANERQKCIEELNSIDGKTEYESARFMAHILERIRKREEARAKLSGGSKELPPQEMIWEGINYYKEQAIAKLSEEVDENGNR